VSDNTVITADTKRLAEEAANHIADLARKITDGKQPGC
jgi:hypothetical protein